MDTIQDLIAQGRVKIAAKEEAHRQQAEVCEREMQEVHTWEVAEALKKAREIVPEALYPYLDGEKAPFVTIRVEGLAPINFKPQLQTAFYVQFYFECSPDSFMGWRVGKRMWNVGPCVYNVLEAIAIAEASEKERQGLETQVEEKNRADERNCLEREQAEAKLESQWQPPSPEQELAAALRRFLHHHEIVSEE